MGVKVLPRQIFQTPFQFFVDKSSGSVNFVNPNSSIMKKLLSIKYSAPVFNISFLLLRLVFGITMCVNHGYSKLIHFADQKDKFIDFLGLGSTATLALVIFAEFFCSIFVTIGLFTRLTVLPLVICMSYALFVANHGNLFNEGESAGLYLSVFITVLLCGPGKISVDGLINK